MPQKENREDQYAVLSVFIKGTNGGGQLDPEKAKKLLYRSLFMTCTTVHKVAAKVGNNRYICSLHSRSRWRIV